MTGPVRLSARTRSWSEAERKAREMEQAAEGRITIERAVAAYVNDVQGRSFSRATVKQRQAFFEHRLLPWCRERRICRLDQLRLSELREFRQTWDIASTTAVRWHERLRSFFTFCVANGWLAANPTNTLKRPVALRQPPTDYFERREFRRIVAAAEK